jgi:hypothetical protein
MRRVNSGWKFSVLLVLPLLASSPLSVVGDDGKNTVQAPLKPDSVKSITEEQGVAPSGFQGIPWNASTTTAKEMMAKLKAFKPVPTEGSDTLMYLGGELGGEKTRGAGLMFDEEGFFCVNVVFNAPEARVFEQYKTINEVITLRYGKPKTVFCEFSPPYSEGDGLEAQAVRRGRAVIATFWFFPDEKSGKPFITTTIQKNGTVKLSYAAGQFRIDRYTKQLAEKKSKDF